MATKEQPTSERGFHTHCHCRAVLVWVDTTHGTPPGPDFCGQACYDKHNETQARQTPAWAVED